jgi:hypothetical protein
MNLKKIKYFFTVLQRTGSRIFGEQSCSEIDKYKLPRDLFGHSRITCFVMGYQIPFNGRVRAHHKDLNELCLFCS